MFLFIKGEIFFLYFIFIVMNCLVEEIENDYSLEIFIKKLLDVC